MIKISGWCVADEGDIKVKHGGWSLLLGWSHLIGSAEMKEGWSYKATISLDISKDFTKLQFH